MTDPTPTAATTGETPNAHHGHAASAKGGRGVGPWIAIACIIGAVVLGGIAGGLIVASVNGSTNVRVCAATSVANDGMPSVVTISASRGNTGGTGSGVIFQTGGYILTNYHVIAPANGSGGQLSVLYSDGTSVSASLVGSDPVTDLAVIKASDEASGRPVMPIGSSENLQVGQPVVALGAPLGLSSTVTSGIVSALNRYVAVPLSSGSTAHLVDAVQTDAAINPGNSGGALVNCDAQLIGINSAIATVPDANGNSGGGSVGLGFAIPSSLAVPIAQQLIDHGSVTHLTIGVQTQAIPSSVAATHGVPQGLYVTGVLAGGPAAAAGIKVGDIITEVNGAAAVSTDQIAIAEISAQTGQTISLTYWSNGQTKSATLTPVPLS
jgi:putative serine protease PepD